MAATGLTAPGRALAPFGPNAARHVLRTHRFPHCPDIVVNSLFGISSPKLMSFQMSIQNNMRDQYKFGSVEPFGQGLGLFDVSGQVEFYFNSLSDYATFATRQTGVAMSLTIGETGGAKDTLEIMNADAWNPDVGDPGATGDDRTPAPMAQLDGPGAAGELGAATARVREVVDGASPVAIEAMIAGIRDRFSGGLFETIQATAVSAVTATQSKRAELARHRRLGSLVGVRPIGRPQALRVGHIAEVTPVSVTLREVMVGKAGSATLLEGAGRRNAGRVGMNGTPSLTVFGLGHIDVVLGDELEAALDEWLAFIRRDVRFLVPESVAGVGVLTIVSSHAGVRDAEVVSEVVRTGQRSVVVRVFIRADHDVEDTVEALRAQVQATYRWPQGLSLAAPDVQRVHHLGPAGTFSEAAARQATGSLGITAGLVPEPDFTGVLNAIGDGVLGVLPISSSASGLVTRSVTALLDHPSDLVAGGVVDVAVRFDAYVQESRQLTDLRGAKVFSHPQALGQCQAFIRRWGLEPEPCPSTAEALTMVAADPEGSVALAVADSEAPGLKVAEREVDDLSGSITRFLVLGTGGAFGDMTGGWDPTLRSLWVADSVATVLDMIEPGSPAFDELLTDGDGRCLWVTSRRFDDGAPAGARYLGRAPWSPRTPVVRVEVDVPRDRA